MNDVNDLNVLEADGGNRTPAVQDKDVAWVQQWLNERAGCDLAVDGIGGSLTRAAFITAFANKNAPAITEAELLQIARDLGDGDTKRIRAVAQVESAGGGWFDSGLPKILFERHKFWKHTTRPKIITSYSNPEAGGYSMDALRCCGQRGTVNWRIIRCCAITF